jgi:hypothetical protein
MPDITAPSLKRISLPATVDLSKGPQTFDVSAEAVDESGGSGIAQVVVWFNQHLAWSDRRSQLLIVGGSWTQDSFADATPTVATNQFTLKEPTPGGTYTIDKVWVTDVAGNRAEYDTHRLKAMGIGTTMQVTGRPVDLTGPTLTSLELPATIDVSKGEVSLAVKVGARDNEGGSGVEHVMLKFDKPMWEDGFISPIMLLGYAGRGDSFDDDTPTAATSPVVFGKATDSGTYRVVEATVYDYAGNETRYSGYDLEALGIATTMTVSGGSVADTSPPELLDLWLPQTVALQSDVHQLVAVSGRDNPGGSGIGEVFLLFDRQLAFRDYPTNSLVIGWSTSEDNFKDATPGMGAHPFALSGAAVPGTFNLTQIWLKDGAGNRASYTAEQLRQRGINTEMTVVTGAPSASADVKVEQGRMLLSLTSSSWAAREDDSFSLTVKYDPAQVRYSSVSVTGSQAVSLSVDVFEAGSSGKVTVSGTGAIPADAALKLVLTPNAASTIIHYAIDGFTVNNLPQAFGANRTGSVVAGTAGPDVIAAGPTATIIDGQGGFDRAVFDDWKANYTVERSGADLIVANGKGTHMTVSNVERVAFHDYTLALDIDGAAGQMYRLYQAAFDRKPNAWELGFWIKKADAGASLHQIADAFVLSSEFALRYGQNASAETFVAALYDNVLHRASDPSGVEFWVNAVKSGVDRADVLIQFSESPENIAQVIASIQDGITYFT